MRLLARVWCLSAGSLLLLALGSIHPNTAWGYVRASNTNGRPLRWLQETVRLEVCAAGAGSAERALVLASSGRAARAWNRVASLRFEVVAADGPCSSVEDGRNLILFKADRWCADEAGAGCHDPSRKAITRPYSREISTLEDAEIVEADIEINAVQFDWHEPERLEALLLHELGHVLGLDHVCVASGLLTRQDHAGQSVPLCRGSQGPTAKRVMFPDPLDPAHELSLTLAPDDELAARSLYPPPPSGPRGSGLMPWLAGLSLLVASVWLGLLPRRPNTRVR